MVGVGYVGCDYDLAVILLCIAGGFAGISSVTTGVNHLDIAPKYAGEVLLVTIMIHVMNEERKCRSDKLLNRVLPSIMLNIKDIIYYLGLIVPTFLVSSGVVLFAYKRGQLYVCYFSILFTLNRV